MAKNKRVISELRLVNGSSGDPCLFLDYPGKHDALLFDGGDNGALSLKQLGDLEAFFITHHHIDHFIGFDRVLRANLSNKKDLQVFGPVGTIEKVLAKLSTYAYQFFPFQKIAFVIHEVLDKRMERCRVSMEDRFEPGEVERVPFRRGVVYETADLRVEAAHVDHTAPCVNYAMVEKGGYHVDPAKIDRGCLKPGKWIGQALERLRAGADPEERLSIEGGEFRLGQLAERYFQRSRGSRVAFITDTRRTDEVWPRLVKLAKGAQKLFCDGYYLHEHVDKAIEYGHLTAREAGELAAEAGVDELVLMHFGPRYRGKFHLLLDEAKAVFPNTTSVHVEGAAGW